MIDLRTHHKFVFFGQISTIEATSENMSKYLTEFSFMGLIPNTVQQIEFNGNPQNGLIESTKVKMRLQFVSPENRKWIVDVNNGNISITELRDEDGKLGERNDFFENVFKIINILTDSYAIKGNRISYLARSLNDETDKEKLVQSNRNLINLPKIYSENPPFEWDTRMVCQKGHCLNGEADNLNIITKISRKSGVMRFTNEPYDRIEIEFDINTSHLNKKHRIEENHIKDFSKFLDEIVPNLEDDVLEIIEK